MKKSLFLMAIATVAISSCSSDETLQVNRGNSIEFRAAMGTRATSEFKQKDLTSFTVMALTANNAEKYFQDVFYSSTPGDENNPGTNYTSTIPYYWPVSDGILNFYAWNSNNSITVSPSFTSGSQPTFPFEPEDEIAKQSDVIVADVQGQYKTQNVDGVEMTFKHALSQIAIKAKNDKHGSYTVKVKGVRICQVYPSGTVTVATDGPSTVDETEDKTQYVVTSYKDDPKPLNGTAVDLMDGVGNAMLFPQKLTAWNLTTAPVDAKNTKKGSFIAVLVDIDAAGGANIYPSNTSNKYAWAAIPIDEDWQRHTKYVYTLDFSSGAGFVAPDEDTDGGTDGSDGTGDDKWEPGDPILDISDPIEFKTVTVTTWDEVPVTETMKL